MHTLFYIGIILISGIIMGILVTYIKLPKVTGYLIAGVLIGPSVLKIIPKNISGNFGIISEVALGFIAYSIGSEFNFRHIKKIGNKIIIITICEALGAVILVDFVMFFIYKQSLPFSLVIGAISAATAPAATLMVIRQYKAKGPLVNTLLPIVAMDDAVGIIIFGVSITIAKSLLSFNGTISFFQMFIIPLWEIFLAIAIGTTIGIVLTFIANKASGEDQLLNITIASLFVSIGISVQLNLSPLLVCMAIGATITNIIPNTKRIFSIVDRFTPPVFVAFFTVAGVELNISLLKDVGVLGLVYILSRVLGKMLGASIGAKLAQSPSVVQKYLGLTLVPQAGVAIGLAMVAEVTLPSPYGSKIRTIILAATVIYELVGPLLTKIAIFKAGEAQIKTSSLEASNANINS